MNVALAIMTLAADGTPLPAQVVNAGRQAMCLQTVAAQIDIIEEGAQQAFSRAVTRGDTEAALAALPAMYHAVYLAMHPQQTQYMRSESARIIGVAVRMSNPQTVLTIIAGDASEAAATLRAYTQQHANEMMNVSESVFMNAAPRWKPSSNLR